MAFEQTLKTAARNATMRAPQTLKDQLRIIVNDYVKQGTEWVAS